MNGGLDCLFIRPLDWHSDRTAAALSHTKNRRLANRAASSLELLELMLVLFEAAYEGFVNFDDALQLFKLRSARLAQPMKDEPCGLLRDPDFLGELHGRNALASRHKQIHRVDPLVQRNVRPLENRSGSNREVLFALIAAIKSARPNRNTFAKPTNRAARAIRPEAAFEINPRRLLVGEHLEKLEGRNCALGHRATPWLRTKNGIKLAGSQVYNSLLIHLYCDVVLAHDDQPEPLEAIETLGAGDQRPQERTANSRSLKPVVDSKEQGSGGRRLTAARLRPCQRGKAASGDRGALARVMVQAIAWGGSVAIGGGARR